MKETMHQIKKVALLSGLVGLLLLLSACGSGYKESKVVSDTSQADPLYKHTDFAYDGSITWNSSYTDIIKKYGEPDWTTGADDTLVLHYKSPKVAGYTFKERLISMSISTGRIQLISVESEWLCDFKKPPIDSARKLSDNVKASLISKYGEPNYVVDNGFVSWRNIYAETEIDYHPIDGNSEVTIVYFNKHDYSNERRYTDVPTLKPRPTATPVSKEGI